MCEQLQLHCTDRKLPAAQSLLCGVSFSDGSDVVCSEAANAADRQRELEAEFAAAAGGGGGGSADGATPTSVGLTTTAVAAAAAAAASADPPKLKKKKSLSFSVFNGVKIVPSRERNIRMCTNPQFTAIHPARIMPRLAKIVLFLVLWWCVECDVRCR